MKRGMIQQRMDANEREKRNEPQMDVNLEEMPCNAPSNRQMFFGISQVLPLGSHGKSWEVMGSHGKSWEVMGN